MCDCVIKMDKALAPKNGRIALAIQFTGKMSRRVRPCVATEKLDKSKRKPVPTVMANYCPFCGDFIAPNAVMTVVVRQNLTTE